MNSFDSGFAELRPESEHEVQYFLFFWSMFEAWSFNCDVNPGHFEDKASEWAAQGANQNNELEAEINFFQSRFHRDEHANRRLSALLNRPLSDKNKSALDRLLTGVTESNAEALHGLICIVYRLRNNLFHGVKLSYGLDGQSENFRNANQVLMHLMQSTARNTPA